MATQITDENFDQYWDSAMTSYGFNAHFADAMEDYGKAIEDNTDVPVVTGEDVADTNADHYSMPLVRDQSGIMSYAKVPLGGQQGLIKAVADRVGEDGMLQAITESDLDSIFPLNSSSSD